VSIRASYNMADIKALVDSGATDNFIHPNFVKRMGLGQRALDKPKNIYNIDDTTNKAGQITHYLTLNVETGKTRKEMRFLITDIGKEDILLGYPWLATYEPRFSWRHGTIDEKQLPIVLRSINPNDRRAVLKRLLTEEKEDAKVARTFTKDTKEQIMTTLEEQVYGRRSAVELAVDAKQYTKEVKIPTEYQSFTKVFSEQESKRFPPKRSCDHAIEFKKGAPEVIDCKIYPMTRVEDAALDDFIDEQIEKGYIRPSKSPYASSFFFIKKKDGKLRPVQDYRCINEWTIRNQYPLPLIDDLIRDLGGAQIFSKLDV